jgi:hypothetical protein
LDRCWRIRDEARDRCYDFKNIFEIKIGEKWRFLLLDFAKILFTTLFFVTEDWQKNRNKKM